MSVTTDSAPRHRVRSDIGRHVFGVASLGLGLVMLAWHEYNQWHHLRYIICAAAVGQMVGGAAILFRRTTKTGAVALCAAYLISSVVCLPAIVGTPKVYNSWGNFFEQFSLLTGAAITFARFSDRRPAETVRRIGRILFGICVVSFTLEQAFYLAPTASLVPKWLPPSQMFWAVMTTVAFGLAAIAIIVNQMALIATRLLTIMIVSFGVLVWVPLIFSDPRNHTNWSETAETFAIAGVAWILAEMVHLSSGRASTGLQG